MTETLAHDTYLIVLSNSYPMNTSRQGVEISQKVCVLVLWMKVASALEGLTTSEPMFLDVPSV